MKVFIIGGGIGGLTAALSLQKKGLDAVLFEASDKLRAKGAGIWMSPNAIKVMEYLGLHERFLKFAVEMQQAAVEDIKGNKITMGSMDSVKNKHKYAIHSVKRQSLHDLLAEDIEHSRIVTGKKLVAVSQDKEKVHVQFSDGSEDDCDILIGADGIRSTVRESVNPGVRLRYSGQTCWYGISSVKLPPQYENITTEIWMGGLRFGFTDVNDGQVYFFAVEKSPAGIDFDGNRTEYLQRLFKDAPPIVAEILKYTVSSDINKGDLSDIKPFIPLAYGRIALLGDAGHATTPNLGQGAAQAMEDGVLLAELLSSEEPVSALKRYEKMRKKRITHIVKTSWRLGQIAHGESFVAKNIVQGLMKRIPENINQKMLDRVFTPVFP